MTASSLHRPGRSGAASSLSAARRAALSIALAASAAAVAGCGPSWVVIQQAVPDPFLNQRQFFLEPVHMDNVVVGDKPEAAYLAEKTPEQRASWLTDKGDMIGEFGDGLASAADTLHFNPQPSPATFIVRPIVEVVEPGFYAGYAAHATELEMRVEILAPSGQVLDAIHVHSAIPAGFTNPASGTRMRQAAARAGAITADYLKSRVLP